MKKIIIFIVVLCLSVLILTSCRGTVIYEDKTTFNGSFRVLKEIDDGILGSTCEYLCDIKTNVVYLYTYAGYHATMCPYYVVVNGEPTIAIYGVNYEN